MDDSHYVPASQHDFYTLVQILELTHAGQKDFSFTQIVIPEYRSKSTPAIRIKQAMVISSAHGVLDGFTQKICQQITNEVEREPENWSFPNRHGMSIRLEPLDEGAAGLSRLKHFVSYKSSQKLLIRYIPPLCPRL